LSNIWTKIPLPVRAVLNGFGIQVIGFAALILIIPANIELLPEVPWTLIPLALFLFLYWTYFGGKGWPQKTSELRQQYRRSVSVEPRLYRHVLFAALSFGLFLYCVAILQYALRSLPPEAIGLLFMLAELPLWTSIPIALFTALFIGVQEEMSYRGYMQVPLESKYGPAVFLGIPALMFAISHGLDAERLPVFFLVSLGWGFLAWRTGSIIPGIFLHTVIDAASFLWGIIDTESLVALLAYSVVDQGFNSLLSAVAILALLMLILTLLSFRKLYLATEH